VVAELEALKLAGIAVFSVAVSSRVAESDARGISSVPQLSNVNYFVAPDFSNLGSLSGPLAAQVFYADYVFECLVVSEC